FPVVHGSYRLEGRARRVVATATDHAALPGALAAVAAQADQDLAVDIYLAWPERPEDQDDVAAALRAELSQVEWLRRVERITVSVAGRAGDVHHRQFTFQPGEGGELVEDTLIRGMHPMVARRLQLQRL